MMAIDAKFLNWIEQTFPGRDIPAHNDEDLHKHGSSTVRYGRGSVLTVDLTNRCNMMCDPCFMDANQVGYVHELGWDEIQEILDNALKIKPRRQMSVQFSRRRADHEPVLPARPWPMRARSATTACRPRPTASSSPRARNSASKAFEAGMRYAYLQFDGIGNDANSHRQIGNLFDVKLRAIENMHEAGIEIVLVVTIVNNVNNDQVGTVVKFAMDNPKKIAFVSFQPVSFTGRDEDITPERRLRQRYTLSHLAKDVSAQVGKVEPTRDWFPHLVHQHLRRLLRHGEGPGFAVGLAFLRLPPQLRRGHCADDQQRDQRVGAGSALPRCRATDQGRDRHHRRGARQDFLKLHDGHGAA